MAGFRGVVPSREALERIVANLHASRAALQDMVDNGADPTVSRNPAKGACTLNDQAGINGMLTEIFQGLLDGTTEVIPGKITP